MYADIADELTLVKIVNVIFDESYFFINFGLNIFFEKMSISIGLYWLEELLEIPKSQLEEIDMFWDTLKITFDFIAEFTISFFIFWKYALVTTLQLFFVMTFFFFLFKQIKKLYLYIFIIVLSSVCKALNSINIIKAMNEKS